MTKIRIKKKFTGYNNMNYSVYFENNADQKLANNITPKMSPISF